ncbi:hypothetical protein BOTCAL_1270g00010 [Botryotinia calthae]|uniref:Chromo domain-containing protein n=1 Tax=Botryotinia calthae TaxID=38488 RepID=A0A4Y8CCT1_9HELO|nr:hypothetical protein BOTCAL_1270g00010 [Botryotinia calthae]
MYFPFSSKRVSWFRCRKSRYAERKSTKHSKIKSRVDRFQISFLSFRRRKNSTETYERNKRFVIKRRFRFRTRFPSRFRSRNLKSSPQTFASRWHFPHFKSKIRCPFNVHLKSKYRKQKRRHVMDISAPIMNMHHPAGVDGSANTPLAAPNELQTIPGYQYPFSLGPENLPEVFYRLHRDENWRDIHSPPPTNSLLCETYTPLEHGWSAKNTNSPLPSSPKQILSLVRKHFSEKSASQPSNSIFVPGVWRAGRSSQVSLWDDIEDAREEARRIGGVDIIEVKGEVLREGGSVVFCLEELLGRSSALCLVTRGRYGRFRGEGGKKRRRKWTRGGRKGGEGLRGKAYLVVGVIPGTHNFPRPTPVIPTTNTNNTNNVFHTQNGTGDSIKEEEIARNVSLNDRTTCGTFGDFDFGLEREQEWEMKQATPLSQTPNPPSHFNYPYDHETSINSEPLNWTLENAHVNDVQEYEIERDIRRHAQRMKRNSAFRTMEKISEDAGNSILADIEFEDEVGEIEGEGKEYSLQGMDGGGSRGWSWVDGGREREREKGKMNDFNSERKITSTARIARKGTFGEVFREKSADLRDEKRASLQSQSFPSRASTMRDSDGRGRAEGTRYVDTGTSTRSLTFREEYSSEDNLSADEYIPAVPVAGAVRKRGVIREAQGMSEGWGEGDGDFGVGEDGNLYFEGLGMGMGVGRKKSRRNEDDCGYRSCMGKEREEIYFGSQMSSFVGTVNYDKDTEEVDEELRDMDTNFNIDILGRGKIPDPRTNAKSTKNSRIPIEYLKSRRPIPKKTISRDTTSDYFENDEDTRGCENEMNKEELSDLVSAEGVKNNGSGSGLGIQRDVDMVRRDMNEKGRHKEVVDRTYFGTSESDLPFPTITIGFPSRIDEIPQMGDAAHLSQSKRISTLPLSPPPFTLTSDLEIESEIEIPEKKNNNEILYSFKSVLALCTRVYNNIPKQCYLIEWEDPWAPTWQVKSETDGVVGEVWRGNMKRWERGVRERGRMERIVWEEEEEEEEDGVEGKGNRKGKGKEGKEGRYLIEWEKDSKPEWVEKREVSAKLVREFERRRGGWRFVDEGERECGGR